MEFNQYTLAWYNKTYKTNFDLTYADYLLGDSEPRDGIEKEKVRHLFTLPNFFLDMSPKPGAIQAIELLSKFFKIKVVTKVFPQLAQTTYMEKVAWVQKYLPQLVNDVVIVTGSKDCVHGDILIDDALKNQKEWKEKWPEGIVASLKYPWTDSRWVDIISGDWDTLAKLLIFHAEEYELITNG